MYIDWQTVFYVVATLTMFTLFAVAVAVIIFIRRVTGYIDKGVRGFGAFGAMMKIKFLRNLLKIIR